MRNLLKSLTSLKGKGHDYVLSLLLALFVAFPVQIPDTLAEMVNNVVGKIVVVVIALCLLKRGAVVGSIGLLAAYELIKRSSLTVVKEPRHRFIPSEAKKAAHLNKYNQFPVTVEEMVIAKQIPYVFNRKPVGNSIYKPVQDSVYAAARL